MKNQFVTYEIALKLKELGFNERCMAEYSVYNQKQCSQNDPDFRFNTDEDLGIIFQDSNIYPDTISAPLWQQVIDWFREKHDVNIIIAKNSKEIIEYVKSKDYSIDISSRLFCWYFIDHDPKGNTSTYSEAREQAILKAIELLYERNS